MGKPSPVTKPANKPIPRPVSGRLKALRRMIYLYAFLLVFEGAIRKWGPPALATPMLIVRDPIVIISIFLALQLGLFRWNIWLSFTAFLAIVTAGLAMTVGHGNLLVTLYGLRSNYMHIPMIFIIGRAFDYEEVCRLGRLLLWACIPMTLLLWKQFHSPQEAWVNVGIGGKGTSTFDAVMGYRRPSGTFSFINGTAQFYSLAAAILFAALLQKIGARWILLGMASVAILMAIPLSISRLLFFGVALVAVGAAFSVILAGRRIVWLIRGAILMVILIAASFVVPGLDTPREVFMARWDVAAKAEEDTGGAIWGRTIVGSANDILNSVNAPLLGRGLGLGTNVGAAILFGGRGFLIAEGEWPRCVGELGLIFGMLFIALRAGIAAMLFYHACISARLRNNVLPLILWFGMVYMLVQGQWGQPTAQGFATLGAGLVLAACRMPSPTQREAPQAPRAKTLPPLKRRIRVPLLPEGGSGAPATP